MRLRCPYCRAEFGTLVHATCPACGKTLQVPSALRPVSELRRRKRAKEMIQRDAERQRRGLGKALATPGRSPLQLAAVVAVLVLVGAIVISGARKPTPRQPVDLVQRAQQELRVLRSALDDFKADVGRYPTPTEGLVVLISNPDSPAWRGPYITVLRPDPWGTPYQYAMTNALPGIASHGPDRIPGTPDDLAPLTPPLL